MTAVGCGSGAFFLGLGGWGLIKNRRSQEKEESTQPPRELVYGPERWRDAGVEILDRMPPTPTISWEENDPFFKQPYSMNYVLLYIPEKIQTDKETGNLTLQFLKDRNRFLEMIPEGEIFTETTAPGWVLIGTRNIRLQPEDERTSTYLTNKVEAQGFQMPKALEITAFSLLFYAVNNEYLFANDSYTFCEDVTEEEKRVIAGASEKKFSVDFLLGEDSSFLTKGFSVTPVKRFNQMK